MTCPVIPGEPLPHDDYAADAGITTPIKGTIVPELVAWMPVSGLSHLLGPVPADAWQRIDQILRRGELRSHHDTSAAPGEHRV
ncbi:hypothetical protein [Parafrankia elaeagni]|uniref:hypothetical protein n=1 Tax=Parafrankia elaeagni TaxID=222534 RepID=UPI0003719E6C|nr:hypothetical protein [Parafrankia elaeagni]